MNPEPLVSAPPSSVPPPLAAADGSVVVVSEPPPAAPPQTRTSPNPSSGGGSIIGSSSSTSRPSPPSFGSWSPSKSHHFAPSFASAWTSGGAYLPSLSHTLARNLDHYHHQPTAPSSTIDPIFEAPDLRNYSLSLQTPSLSAAVSFNHQTFRDGPVVTPVSTQQDRVTAAAAPPATSWAAEQRVHSPAEEKESAGKREEGGGHTLSAGGFGRHRGLQHSLVGRIPGPTAFSPPLAPTDTPEFSTPSSTSSYGSHGLFSPLPTPSLGSTAAGSYPFNPIPPASLPSSNKKAHHRTHSSHSHPYTIHPPHRRSDDSDGFSSASGRGGPADESASQHSRSLSRTRAALHAAHHPSRLASSPYFHHDGSAHSPVSGMSGGTSAGPSSVGVGAVPGPSSSNGTLRSERGVGPAAEREREKEGATGALRRPALSHRMPSAPPYALNTLKRDREGDPHLAAYGGAAAAAAAAAGLGPASGLSSIRESSVVRDEDFFTNAAGANGQGNTLHHVQSLPALNGQQQQQGWQSTSTGPAFSASHQLSGASPGVATPTTTATEAAILDLDTLYGSLREALLKGKEHTVVESTKALGRKVEEVMGTKRVENMAAAMEAKRVEDQINSMDVDSGQPSKAAFDAEAMAKSHSLSRRPSAAPLQPPPLPTGMAQAGAAPPPLFHSQSTPVVPMQHQFAGSAPAYPDPTLGHSTFTTPAASAQTAGIHLPAHMMVQGSFGQPSSSSSVPQLQQQHQVPPGMGIPQAMTPISGVPPSSGHRPPALHSHIRQASAAAHQIIHSTPPSPGVFRAQYEGPIAGQLGVSVPVPLQQTHASFLPPDSLSMPANPLAGARDPAAPVLPGARGAPPPPGSLAARRKLSRVSMESLRDLQQPLIASANAASGSGGVPGSSSHPSPATNDSSPAIRSRRNTVESRPPSRAISEADFMDDLSPSGNAFGSSSAAAVAAANAQANASDAPAKGAGSQMGAATAGVAPELQQRLDPIFFGWLGKLCSDLEMTDSKGELIHQTLMAKKMQRLEESTDYRPFKFRIQAFTNGLYDELLRSGFTENELPLKKVRQYLWSQTCISRFNEEGKKAKSKGNHVWHIEAKKIGEGRWKFMEFTRKIVGRPAKVAYCGIKWVWAPRVWDPQCSVQSIKAVFSSPVLPPWLSWKENVLSGVPTPDAQSVDITALAVFTQNGMQQQLEYSFHLLVTQIDGIDHHRKAELESFSYSNVPSTTNSARSTPRHSPEPQLGVFGGAPIPADPELRQLSTSGLVRTESGNNLATAGAPDLGLHSHEIKHEMLDPGSAAIGMPLLAPQSLLPGVSDAITQALEQPISAGVIPPPSLAEVSMVPSSLAHQSAIIDANIQAQNMAAAIHDAQVETIRNNLLSADQNIAATASTLLSQAISSHDPAQQQLAAEVLGPLNPTQPSRPPTASGPAPAFPMLESNGMAAQPSRPSTSAGTFGGMAVDPSVLTVGPGPATDPIQPLPPAVPQPPDAMGMAMDFDLTAPQQVGVLPNQVNPASLLGDLSRPPSEGGQAPPPGHLSH